ncbi:hypothetical protein COOONC_25717 [Cooperia oncophora]
MHITSLCYYPHKPCILLRFQNLTVLLDCAVDFSSFNHFLPYVYDERSRLKNLPSFHGDTLSYLKQLNENVFVEAVPEVHLVPVRPFPYFFATVLFTSRTVGGDLVLFSYDHKLD